MLYEMVTAHISQLVATLLLCKHYYMDSATADVLNRVQMMTIALSNLILPAPTLMGIVLGA